MLAMALQRADGARAHGHHLPELVKAQRETGLFCMDGRCDVRADRPRAAQHDCGMIVA
jgi:hypothetical protein